MNNDCLNISFFFVKNSPIFSVQDDWKKRAKTKKKVFFSTLAQVTFFLQHSCSILLHVSLLAIISLVIFLLQKYIPNASAKMPDGSDKLVSVFAYSIMYPKGLPYYVRKNIVCLCEIVRILLLSLLKKILTKSKC